MACSICGKDGHNMATCDAVELDFEVEVDSIELKSDKYVTVERIRCSLELVNDGDTVTVNISPKELRNHAGIKQTEWVRLYGIDAPEANENYKGLTEVEKSNLTSKKMIGLGKLSTGYLTQLLDECEDIELVYLRSKNTGNPKRDKSWRLLGYLFVNGEDIGGKMLEHGYAVVWPREIKSTRFLHKLHDVYIETCCSAMKNQDGIWHHDKLLGIHQLCPIHLHGKNATLKNCNKFCHPAS